MMQCCGSRAALLLGATGPLLSAGQAPAAAVEQQHRQHRQLSVCAVLGSAHGQGLLPAALQLSRGCRWLLAAGRQLLPGQAAGALNISRRHSLLLQQQQLQGRLLWLAAPLEGRQLPQPLLLLVLAAAAAGFRYCGEQQLGLRHLAEPGGGWVRRMRIACACCVYLTLLHGAMRMSRLNRRRMWQWQKARQVLLLLLLMRMMLTLRMRV